MSRFVILKDKKIAHEHVDELERQFTDLVYERTGLTPTFFVHEEDYSNAPTETDSDGDLKPTKAYTKALMDKVHKLYGNWGTDSVVMLVHQDNWIYTGIWGTNWSNVYHTYHVHLCRFDKKNMANTLGTFYHEWMHSLDALIKTHTGVDINQYFSNTKCWVSWDATLVHGNKFTGCQDTPFKYIKWKDNADALTMIKPDLIKAYKVRKDMYLAPYRNALLQAVSILRGLLNRKQK